MEKKLSFDDFWRELDKLKKKAQKVNARFDRAMITVSSRIRRKV